MYVRKDLKITVINPDIDKINSVDDVWIQVQHRKFPSIIVGCVYRHPRALAASFSYLADVFKYVCLRNKPVFILGDLNDNQFVNGNNLCRIIKSLNLTQVVDKPTRITANSSTLLDVIITNSESMIIKSDVSPSPIADHETISSIVNFHKPKIILDTQERRLFPKRGA